MLKTSRFHRQARGLLLLGICLLILSTFPARPASAATSLQTVDNRLEEFARGTFQRSSLSALQASPAGKDLPGAVQLAPIGILKNWFDSPFLLPEQLSDIGAVALGNRIFVIGGLVGSTQTAHVWSTAVDPSTGAPIAPGWQAEPNLPTLRVSDASNFLPEPHNITPAVSVPAVAAVQTNAATNSGYIYVMGGSAKPPGLSASVSSYGVSIGTVANGRITGWAASSDLDNRLRVPPHPAWGQNGVQSASAVSFTTGGNTYVYLLGGLQRYLEGTKAVEAGSNLVFYAQVRTSDGMLVKPSSPGTPGWDSLAAIPIPTGGGLGIYAGLWDGAAVADHFDVGGGAGGDVLYMMGGQLQSNVGTNGAANAYNAKVYRALINSSNGTLTWTSPPAPNPWEGALPSPRLGMAAVDFRGTLYVTGGRPIVSGLPANPQQAVLTSYVEDNLTLADIGSAGSNFVINDSLPGMLPRARHGSVVVAATPTPQSPNAAYVYVIAGQGPDLQGSDTLIYGKIGSSEDTTATGFAASGWYYSTPHDMLSTSAQVQRIEWTTAITGTRPMDIQVQFRTSTASDCNDSAAFTGSAWQDVDGSPTDQYFSVNGLNQFNQVTPPSHCFQYRAKLTNTSAGAKTTPSLLNVSIEVVIPGFPDLKVQTLQASLDSDKTLSGLSVTIQNQNTFEPPTQPANVEGGGSFFVDLFVFGPNPNPAQVVTPTLPLESNNNNPPSSACIRIEKNQMPVNSSFQITQWYDPADPGCNSQPKDILSLFKQPGHYIVIVAVDTSCPETPSYGCVNEGTLGGESNNVNTPKNRIEFDVAKISYKVHLPLVAR